jgi:ferredoxin/coenzyme F420-reducing hydrogenase delta subunit
MRGAQPLRSVETVFVRLDRAVTRWVPEAMNPLAQLGAIATTALVVASVSGVGLLLWYAASVYQAYTSVVAMGEAPFTAGLVRSLHRYSSDLAMFFVLVHAVRTFSERRVTHARWLPWVTGVLALGVMWFVGWTGYWLVWDARGLQVAQGTARLLDGLPIFLEPLSRSFVAQDTTASLMFFVVFFAHMLVPVGIVIVLWLHLARVSRPVWITGRPMTAWVVVCLVVLSLVWPADVAAPADPALLSPSFTMDWWYLAPLVLTDRLGTGALWGVLLVGSAVVVSLPWTLARRAVQPAVVETSRCNACSKCYADCPFDAIRMVPRTDGNDKYALQAEVDPTRCVECGVCAGACDSAGVGVPQLLTLEVRHQVDTWLAESPGAYVAWLCAHAAGGDLNVDPLTGRCEQLPGYVVVQLPCAAWLHPLSVERVMRRGAGGVLISSCPGRTCLHREGALWLGQRLHGQREPSLREDKVDADRIRELALDRTRTAEFLSEAAGFVAGKPQVHRAPTGRGAANAAAVVLAALLCLVTAVGSDLVYATPAVVDSELVVTFKHPGVTSEDCRVLTAEELASRPAHMRPQEQVCDRTRAPVRLRITIDGEQVLAETYQPAGLWSDGSSVAIARLPVPAGRHDVKVELGDTPDEAWTYHLDEGQQFETGSRRVLTFDRVEGFRWH